MRGKAGSRIDSAAGFEIWTFSICNGILFTPLIRPNESYDKEIFHRRDAEKPVAFLGGLCQKVPVWSIHRSDL
jgi:hypothetical protein